MRIYDLLSGQNHENKEVFSFFKVDEFPWGKSSMGEFCSDFRTGLHHTLSQDENKLFHHVTVAIII